MKQSKKLTREQKIAVSAANLNSDSWLLVEQTEFYLKIIHKTSGKTRRVDRYTIPKQGGKKMNLDVVKVVDCLDMYYMKRQCSILNDGKLIGFQPKEEKEIPTQTANPSGDK